MWLGSVYEGFIITFATCGVFFRGLIYLLELWTVLLDQGMQIFARIAALRVLGPSSAWFRIALASMSRASSSGVCGGSAVVVVAAGRWVSRSGGSRVRGRAVGMIWA
jgi:hypothetical protein